MTYSPQVEAVLVMPNAEGVLNAAGSLGYCESPSGLRGEPCWGLWRSVQRNVRKVFLIYISSLSIFLIIFYRLYFLRFIFSFLYFYRLFFLSCNWQDKYNFQWSCRFQASWTNVKFPQNIKGSKRKGRFKLQEDWQVNQLYAGYLSFYQFYTELL